MPAALAISKPQPEFMFYQHIQKYNELWQNSQISCPVVIMIGGYAGTGKSTLAQIIFRYLNYLNLIPTGILRALVKDYISVQDNPALYYHTYDLFKLIPPNFSGKVDTEVTRLFVNQVRPLSRGVSNLISFAAREKQHYLIEGNHIFPGLLVKNELVIQIEFYLKVSAPHQHRLMLGGPTHNRVLDDRQFQTGRILHDLIVNQAKSQHKYVYEYNEAERLALQMIDETLKSYVEGV